MPLLVLLTYADLGDHLFPDCRFSADIIKNRNCSTTVVLRYQIWPFLKGDKKRSRNAIPLLAGYGVYPSLIYLGDPRDHMLRHAGTAETRKISRFLKPLFMIAQWLKLCAIIRDLRSFKARCPPSGNATNTFSLESDGVNGGVKTCQRAA